MAHTTAPQLESAGLMAMGVFGRQQIAWRSSVKIGDLVKLIDPYADFEDLVGIIFEQGFDQMVLWADGEIEYTHTYGPEEGLKVISEGR
jgi:hypothetical protein